MVEQRAHISQVAGSIPVLGTRCKSCNQPLDLERVCKDFCSLSCKGKYANKFKIKKKCPSCQRLITKSNFKKHVVVCTGSVTERKIQIRLKDEWKIDGNLYKCPHCKKEFSKKGICSHIWRVHTSVGQAFKTRYGEPKTELSRKKRNWNKGLTKEDHSSIQKCSTTLRKGYKTGRLKPSFKGKQHSPQARKKISIAAKGRKGRNHPISKTFYYKHKDGSIVVLESSYEVKVAKSLDLHNIHWIRPDSVIWTDSKGEDHRYFPDFYLVEFDIYLDPKNDYLIKKDTEKIRRVQEQNNIRVVVLDSKHLEWERIRERVV